MGRRIQFSIAIPMIIALFASFSIEAKPLTRREASKYIQEGEYDIVADNTPRKGSRKKHTSVKKVSQKKASKKAASKRMVARKTISKKRAPASVRAKSTSRKPKVIKVKSRRPASSTRHKASHSKSKSKKKSQKRHSRKTSHFDHRKVRLPYAKETPNERDMPFISVPKSRVRKEIKTIVMEDPGEKPAALTPVLPEPPDGTEIKSTERTPAAKPEPAAAPVAPPAPVVEADAAVARDPASAPSTPREPDAFDIHSGADPMRSPGAD